MFSVIVLFERVGRDEQLGEHRLQLAEDHRFDELGLSSPCLEFYSGIEPATVAAQGRFDLDGKVNEKICDMSIPVVEVRFAALPQWATTARSFLGTRTRFS